MRPVHFLATLLAAISFGALPASAAEFVFNITGPYNAAFSIDSALISSPTYSDDRTFIVENVLGSFDGVTTTADSVTFNTSDFDGGLTLQLGNDFLNLWGQALFTGTTGAPTLRFGDFALFQDGDSDFPVNLTVSAAAPAVPEPTTWALMLIGFGATGYTMRKRQATVRHRTA